MKRMQSWVWVLVALATSDCTTSPIVELPPHLFRAEANANDEALNGGRVQSIAVSPVDRNRELIATEYGGLWQTWGGGSAWFWNATLPNLFVSDVEFGSDGKTAVAAAQYDNGVVNGGGIYVSHNKGEAFLARLTKDPLVDHFSANSVSHAPDEAGLWYVGTSAGVAISSDNGDTWTTQPLRPVQSVLAMPGGSVLAMTDDAIWRSDDRGTNWRAVINANFSFEGLSSPPRGGNKMDRSPFARWAFILQKYGPTGGSLIFYDLDDGQVTVLPTPQGNSRGPFVRVSKDMVHGGKYITIWIGHGWDGYKVTREDANSIRAIRSDPQRDDWVSFIAPAGVHSDTGDLGLDGDLQPALFGSDGGIFKPRPGAPDQWMSAATPGSGLNSFLIADLAGTNVGSGPEARTALYLGLWDNGIWASPDGGRTWPNFDGGEAHALEVRPYAAESETAMIGYRQECCAIDRFADMDLANLRIVSSKDESGNLQTGFGPAFFVNQAGGPNKESVWQRYRWPADGSPEAYVSVNSGRNWRETATINLGLDGEPKLSAGKIAWQAVTNSAGGIGLIVMAPKYAYDHAVSGPVTYDDSDVISLPGDGSLGQRCVGGGGICDVVFAVHPTDWRYLIAPDINSNAVKVSRDAGTTWSTDVALTAEVLRGGELKLWNGDADHMEVTAIAFEPPAPTGTPSLNRIFVGTRDAGIICSDNDGATWRTIKNSDLVKFVTGFHFRPDGAVYVSSYGHGLWYIKPSQQCPEAYHFKWDSAGPILPPIRLIAPGELPPLPRGVPDPTSPKLFLLGSQGSPDLARVQDDGMLRFIGKYLPPDREVTISLRKDATILGRGRTDPNGNLTLTLTIPDEIPFGVSELQVNVDGSHPLFAAFSKSLPDEARRSHDH